MLPFLQIVEVQSLHGRCRQANSFQADRPVARVVSAGGLELCTVVA